MLPTRRVCAPPSRARLWATSTRPLRSDRKDQSVESFTPAVPAGRRFNELEAALYRSIIIGESQNFTRSLVNEPGNKLTPHHLGARAALMAR